MIADEPLPRWFLALPVLVVALWWPIEPFWASDDFIALHYAQDGTRVLHDFVGPQYGAADVWLFYRPLITASFWFDGLVAGGDPFWAHLANVLAHACSALLVALVWRRVLPDGLAFCTGLSWAIAPSHVATVAWAVGRVDGYTAVPMLLGVLCFLRWQEGSRRGRLQALLAFAVALLCKELALALPGVLALVAFARASGSLGARVAAAVRGVWPFALLLAAYLGWRTLVLGRFGGYGALAFDPAAMARGLGTMVRDVLDPLVWIDPAQTAALGPAAAVLPWTGALPALVGVATVLRRGRADIALLCVLVFLVAAVPVAGFFAAADNLHNLRYLYLPFAALAGLLCCSPIAAAVTLLTFLPAFVSIRHEQWQADRQSARMHAQLADQLGERAVPGPWFVAGLPHANARGTALQFHFGIDRMLLPPFAPGGVRVFAHRPILDVPGALRLDDDEGLPVAPPDGTTLLLRGGELLTTVPRRPLRELPLVVDGSLDLTPDRLQRLKDTHVRRKNGDPAQPVDEHVRFVTPGVRPSWFRVTIFTATGYLCAVVPDHAPAGATDGVVDLVAFLATAAWTQQGGHHVVRALEVPAVLDLDPSFPVLFEAGRVDGGRFVATHRARSMPLLRFDRGYPAWVRRALGIEH